MKLASRHPLLVGTASMILASATLYGCKDFLSTAAAPQGTLNEQTLSTLSGVEGTLVGAYRALDCTNGISPDWGCAASNWVWGSVASDDSYKGSDGGDQPPINDIEGYHWGTGNAHGYLESKWRLMYEGIVRANSTINLLHEVQKANAAAIPAATASSIEGEAIFLRAHYHFEAWKMWGNIPYYREDDVDFRKPNLASTAVAAEIIKDLDAAIAKLPATPRNGQKGRATSWTAKAYKGRVQVYNGQFADALTTLRDVKASGPYGLETSFDKVWTGFADEANGPETIWAYQASSNDGEPNGNNANWGERLNFPYGGLPGICCGFNQPSQNLVNFFKVDAAGLPLALSNPSGWNASSANFTSASTDAVDPRVDFTVGRDGVPYKDWGKHDSQTWIRDLANGGTYSPKKNAHELMSGSQQAAGGWDPQQQNSVNMHLYRYADLLLLLAEAEVEAGSLANALADVNLVRARAGVKAQGPGTSRATLAVPINDPSITWANYKVGLYTSFPSQAVAREAVRAERRLELAMEGQRMFDLRRWGTFDSVLNGYVNGVGGGAEKTRRVYLQTAEAVASRHRWYPIPANQLELSKVGTETMLKQNPGW